MSYPASLGPITQLHRSYRHIRGWLTRCSLFLLLVGMLCTQNGAPMAHAAPLTDAFTPLPIDQDYSMPYPFVFQGGWIQQHPKVYLDFWGPKWSDVHDPNYTTYQGIISSVQQIFRELPGSQYNNILTQYNNPQDAANPLDFVHNDVQYMDTWVDPTVPPSQLFMGVENLIGGEIKDEAANAYNHWHVSSGLSPDKNTQIIVFPQQGSTYRNNGPITMGDACGMHTYDPDFLLAYGWVRYAADGNCNQAGDLAQDMAWHAVHEYAEAATDPHVYFSAVSPSGVTGSGWNMGKGITPQELADMCEDYSPSYNSADSRFDVWNGSANNGQGQFYTDSSGHRIAWPYYVSTSTSSQYALPLLWSEAANGGNTQNPDGCVMSVGNEYWSPDFAAPVNGKHTVQGAILTRYIRLGGQSSQLREPKSEEYPVLNAAGQEDGQVSYFQGTPCGSPNDTYGAIYSTYTGTGSIIGCIDQYYANTLGGPHASNVPLGYPIGDQQNIPGGYYNQFQGTPCGAQTYGAIYYGVTKGWVVGCIEQYYEDLGSHGTLTVPLSFPVGGQQQITGGWMNQFHGTQCGTDYYGAIYYGVTKGWAVGCIEQYYEAVGGPNSALSFPVNGQLQITGGYVNYFHGKPCGSPNDYYGAIYYGATKGWAVGCIEAYYAGMGGPSSSLGFPVGGQNQITGGYYNDFHGTVCSGTYYGSIYYGSSHGAILGCIAKLYKAIGGPFALGFPIYDQNSIPGGYVNYFDGHGCSSGTGPLNSSSAIYNSSAGTHLVEGCIYYAYIHNFGGYSGPLGFPTKDEFTNGDGYRESDFIGGSIIWENGVAVEQLNCVGTGLCN